MTLTDSGRPAGDRPQADPFDAQAPVGTVAEEAAKLVEMLAGSDSPWAGSPRAGSPRADTASGAHGTASTDPDDASSGQSADEDATAPPRASHECTCGGTTPQACRICPVCQVISFVSSISPETIERAADLVGFAAIALRDLASAQRSRQAGPAGSADPAGHASGEDSVP